jgi:hypothetical protein
MIGTAIFAVVGALMIAIPVVVENHAGLVAVGAAVGTAFTVILLSIAVANRESKAQTGSGIPAWASGIGIAAAAIGITAGKIGLGGNFVLGLMGGILLSYAIALVVLPRLIHDGRQGASK